METATDELAEVTVVEPQLSERDALIAECTTLHREYVLRMWAERDRLATALWRASHELGKGANSHGYGNAYVVAARDLNRAGDGPAWLQLWTPGMWTRVTEGTFIANASVTEAVPTPADNAEPFQRFTAGEVLRLEVPQGGTHSFDGRHVTLRRVAPDSVATQTYVPEFD